MGNEVLLKAELVNKSFGPTHAVADFSMEIAPGEIRGLIGENGSGKSTFSAIVVGLHKPDSGKLTFKGEDYAPTNTEMAAQRGVSLIVQEIGTIASITVAANIFINEEIMKKLLSMILVLCMVLSMAACGASEPVETKAPEAAAPAEGEAAAPAVAEKKELKKFTLGMLDPGAWNAAYGPVIDQVEALKEDLNFETIYATKAGGSADDILAAIQNLIVSGADCIIFGNEILMCYMQAAEICEDAGVYFTMYWAGVTEADRETLKSYKYWVGGFYEDEETAGYLHGKAAGEAGCKNLVLIGAPDGLDFTIRRNKGLARACEEYGMTILAQERDLTLTGSAAGGMDIMNRFLATYPEADGVLIQGRTHSCLPGVVNALTDAGKTADIPVFAIDCNINQTEYFANGQEAAVIGGHHLGGMYGLILLTNIMNGTPLTEEKVYL